MPKIKVDLNCTISNSQVKIDAKANNHIFNYLEVCNFEFAKNSITSIDEIKNQFNKTGGTPFEFSNIQVEMEEKLFIPKSIVNNIRRNLIEFLKGEIIKINMPVKKEESVFAGQNYLLNFNKKYKIKSYDNSDIIIADKIDFDGLNCKSTTKIVLNYNNFDKIILNYVKNHNNLYVRLPKIAMKADLEVILKFMEKLPKSVGIYAENYYQYYLAVTTERPLIGGLGLNIYNRESVELLGLNSFVVSSELTKSEIKRDI